VFNVNLDVSSISFTIQYWLETNINGQTLAPRSRLTSAPYSLYSLAADTANYVRNPPTTSDSALIAGSSQYADSARASHLSDSAKSVAAASIKGLIDADSSRASHIADSARVVAGHYVGESYGGGIVFYVDAKAQHGLIAATTDQSAGIQWYNGSYTTTYTVRDGIGAGMYNTPQIMIDQTPGNYAAQSCASYQGGGYGDWYLPSKYELNLLYQQKAVVGAFSSLYYWSSTEYYLNNNDSWMQSFSNGYQYYYDKSSTFFVRAIRAF
jgi:hypothetical protein